MNFLKTRKPCIRAFMWMALLVLAVDRGILAQSSASGASPVVSAGPGTTAVDSNKTEKPAKPVTPKQKELNEATAKLLQLANELKAELDKSNKDTLSLTVMRKADEVEKQAHIVRDKMRAVMAE